MQEVTISVGPQWLKRAVHWLLDIQHPDPHVRRRGQSLVLLMVAFIKSKALLYAVTIDQ